jgi:hypothetical protein
MASIMQLIQPRYSRSANPGVAPYTKLSYLPPNTTAVAASSLNTESPLYKEAASQTYGVGSLVYRDSAGQVAILTDSTGVVTSEIAGSALRAASGVTNAPASFHAIRHDEIWVMNLYHSTPSLAVSALTQLDTIYGLILVNGKFHIDIENTTVEDATTASAYVRVTGFAKQGLNSSGQFVDQDLVSFGDRYAWTEVMFIQETRGTDGAPSRRNLQFDS